MQNKLPFGFTLNKCGAPPALAALFFLAVLVCSSCTDEYLFKKQIDIPAQAWAYGDTLRFDFAIADTTTPCDLLLEVHHATSYGFQNLYVQMHTRFPSGREERQVLSLELAGKNGAWQGDCGSQWCTLQIPIQQRVVFREAGNYSLAVEQYMRQSPLPGVTGLTLKIKRAKTGR